MRALGAEIINTPKELGMLGVQEKANQLLREIPKSHSLKQFENPQIITILADPIGSTGEG